MSVPAQQEPRHGNGRRWVVLGGFSSKRARRLGSRFDENITGDNAAPVPLPASPTGDLPAPRRPSAEAILTLICGVLASVTGVYIATHSVLITVIAVATALMVVRTPR
jgi:hypothetical protein